jgi:antirestriction protein ArdC
MVTDNIIAMLDKSIVPWCKPWRSRGQDIPKNTWGRPYRGINVFILAMQSMAKGYKSSHWLTFKQVGERGGKVNEGEKSTLVVFWKKLTVPNTDPNGNVIAGKPTKNIMLLRYFLVFNLDQTSGVKMTKNMEKEYAVIDSLDENGVQEQEMNDDAEAIIGTYLSMDGAPSWSDGSAQGAYYSPAKDAIAVPDRATFTDGNGWYATNFHEMGHSTGIAKRCNRKGVDVFDHFGSEKYANEELVAEMTSAFLCAEAGVDNTVENSVAYIQSWRKRLSDDPTLIVKAAGQAQKAADYILGTTFEQEKNDE